jgi:hypothetical protein
VPVGERLVDEVRPLPKRDGGLRWITRLTHEADDAYARLVAAHVAAPPRGPLLEERRRWHERLRRHFAAGDRLFRSDVTDCYPSIGATAVGAGLRALGSGHDAELERFLRSVASQGAPGLAVGPEASAVLADIVLSVADRAARAVGAEVVRWVDDVVFIAPERRVALSSFDAWRGTLAQLGLRPHEGKTGWIHGDTGSPDPSAGTRPRAMMHAL